MRNTWSWIEPSAERKRRICRLYTVDLPDTVEYDSRSIGSMNDFTELTHLSIRIGNLLSYDDTSEYEVSIPTLTHRLVDLRQSNMMVLRLYGYKKGKFEEADAHVHEMLAQKEGKLPKLKTIEVVEECILGVAGTYPAEPDESELWQRPRDGLNWLEISSDDEPDS